MTKNICVLVLLLLLPQCGKKRRNFFHYQEKQPSSKINQLTLPAVKGITFKNATEKNNVSWLPIEHPDLIGYNVYRFTKGKFVRKNPINKQPVTEAKFFDNSPNKKHNLCYLVRGVFHIKKQTIEGPTSQIICR